MEMLAGVLETQNKYEEGISVCQEAIRQARILGYKKEEAVILSTMARTYIGMKNNTRAQECFEQAVDLLEGTDDVREMSRLSTLYGEYMTFLINQEQTSKAIETGYKREIVIQRMSEQPGPPPGYIDQQYGFLYTKNGRVAV